jgi:carbonic anhydrase/acetyltransferase-like protein (isoleucine patch superfamily)
MAKRHRALNRDSAPHLFNCALTLCRQTGHTMVARCLAAWWGVHLGNDCRFLGLPIFRRLPGSKLTIGDRCEFRSAKWANLVGINRPCIISTMFEDAVLEIGAGSGFSGTIIGCASRITLGERVMCGANVTISDTDWHPLDWRSRAAGMVAPTAPVSIGDDVWLGMNTVVLKGVTIGRRTVVGAGSIVSRSLPEGVIAAGSPARVIREVDSAEPRESVVLQFSTRGLNS